MTDHRVAVVTGGSRGMIERSLSCGAGLSVVRKAYGDSRRSTHRRAVELTDPARLAAEVEVVHVVLHYPRD